MGFVYMAVATLGIAGNFLLQKFYQTKFCKNTIAVVFMPLVLAILNFLYFFIFNGFKIEYTSFSFIMAFLYALTTTYNTIIGLIIMKYCSMSYFSLFIMMGGMFLPFWYGVFFSPVKETVTALKIVGLVLLIAALVMISVNKSKISLKGFL